MNKLNLILIILLTLFLTSCGCTEHVVKQSQQETATDSIKLASFNIQILGMSKISKEIPQQYIPKIIREYDIVAIQELRDSSTETIDTLKRWLPEYQFVVSERLGRSNSKEQYIVAYRKGKVISSEVWTDTEDMFEREPQITYIQIGNLDFNLINNHIKPDNAEKEIIALKTVIDYATRKDKDFILVGDLNADCSYYNEELTYLKEYNWIIDNGQDTTLAESSCTYDRIITNMDSGKSGVNNYQVNYNLTLEEAELISDHFPVWVELIK